MFATRTITGSSGAATQTLCGRSARAIRRVTIACSSRSLAERSSCSPRWSSTAGSAERRVEPASATVDARRPVAAHQQLGRGADERGVAAAGAVDVAGREARAQDAEDRGGVVRRRRVHGDLAGEHDLLERARADPLDRARDGRLVVLGRRDATRSGSAPRAPGRAAAAARSRSSARRALDARERAPRARRRASASTATVSRTSRPRRASASSGTMQVGGAEAGPVRRGGAVGREREAADGDQPRAGRAVGRVGDGRRRRARATRAATAREAVRPARLEPRDAAERGERRAVAVGLLEAEPGVARRAARRTRRRSGRPRGRRARVSAASDAARRSGARAARRARSGRSSSARAAP